MEFPFQNSIVFPEFHSLYEPCRSRYKNKTFFPTQHFNFFKVFCFSRHFPDFPTYHKIPDFFPISRPGGDPVYKIYNLYSFGPITFQDGGSRYLFVCLFGFLTSSSTTRLYRGRAPRQERLTILRAATHETELGDHDFCLSRSHYTDTDPTCKERAATAGIEPGTSSPGVARSTAELPRPPLKVSNEQAPD